MKKQLLPIIIVCLSLTGCANNGKIETVVTPTANELIEFEVPEPIPQPISGKGSVTGQILTDNSQELVGLIVYLGELIQLPENTYGAYLDTKSAPSSLISIENGKFYFKDVEPGIYSLIIYEVMMGGKVYQDTNGSAIPIEVNEGEITNVGKIEFFFSGNE
ncbi:MAG: hypothetical protein KA807_17145 [Prolixibacteraceae bacterium]|nr:hypothetical protein [Prolixibacteraceae bacterium]